MKTQLEQFIRTHTKSPKESEIAAILNIFEERTYSKGSIFKAANTISQEVGFITAGSVRLYMVKENGQEVTGEILQHHSFVTDLISTRENTRTGLTIQCLEPSSILVAPVAMARELLEINLTFNILIREYIAGRAVELGKKQMLFITGTAKERYQFILQNNPDLLKKFPLRFIASIIGITPTQLSRIRNNK